MRLGTLRVKSNTLREMLYMMNLCFVHVGAERAMQALRPVGVKFFGQNLPSFTPSTYFEADVMRDFLRYFGDNGDVHAHIYFKFSDHQRIIEACETLLAAAYKKNPKLLHLEPFIRLQIEKDLAI